MIGALQLKALAEQTQATPVGAPGDNPDLGAEAKNTTHIILAAFDRRKQGLEILHKDLFDSNSQVVLSALKALGQIKDPRSLKFISRLLTQQEERIRCAAAEAVGEINHPFSAKILMDLLQIAKGEKLRCTILAGLGKCSPKDPAVLHLIEEYSTSRLVSAETRAAATGLLLQLKKGIDVANILTGAKEQITETVLALAETDEEIAVQVIRYGISNFHRLSPKNRSLLIALTSSYSVPGSVKMLLQAFEDVDPEVRQIAYHLLGHSARQIESFPAIIACLLEHVDPSVILEEEVIEAIKRMEHCLGASSVRDPGIKEKVYKQIPQLFKVLSSQEQRVGSDSHELGWLIARSREYLEYYADEDFRQAILLYLKGSSYYTQERLLGALKSSAVKVEVRHFDGYRALVDIIKNPKRPGIGLISRELAIAKLGKRTPFCQLIRSLWLSRLFSTEEIKVDALKLFQQIYCWAKQAKLFRLAEAALFALAKLDKQKAMEACQECMAPPVFSKILAIAGIRLLKDMDWAVMEPAVLKLLGSSDDSHILLNLIDALCSAGFPVSGEVIKVLVSILGTSEDQEIAQRVAAFLGTRPAINLFGSLTEIFDGSEAWKQGLILSIVEREIADRKVSNREGLIEFLYKILRSEGSAGQVKAAVLLWRMGDDYALKVLKDFILNRGTEEKIEILCNLSDALNADIVSILFPLLRLENTRLQEALRATLLGAEEESAQQKICEMVLSFRGEGSFKDEPVEETNDAEIRVDFLREKKAFKFEHEYVQEMAILFTDIQGYSKKAQALSTLQLTSLIQNYEGILLPTLSSHRGELIKKMGDGHLFVFQSPLNSVLAAIRLQKALKRFNSYQDATQRLVIRVGIHWGKVVRQEGDVLGNHVNIASRLESSARGGTIFISEALYRRLGGHIHSREIGLINVKGISEPIKVYEPYEIVVELPAELDPLKSKKVVASPAATERSVEQGDEPQNDSPKDRLAILDRKTVTYISETFSSLNGLCRKAEMKQIAVEEIREELVKRWKGLKTALKKGMEK